MRCSFFLPNERLIDKNLKLNWTLYLRDTLPIQGEIDVASEFTRQIEGDDGV